MKTSTGRPERIRWHGGHRLGHVDLDDWARFEPGLLSLHVRATHATWGVAEGLHLARTASHESIVVSPGFGYDCRGDLVALAAATSSKPPGTGRGRFVLALRASEPESAEGCWTSPGCPGGAHPAAPGATLVWLPEVSSPSAAHCERRATDLHLGRFLRSVDGSLSPPDRSLRRTVRPIARPPVGRGVAAGSDLDWLEGRLSLFAWLDTSSASFDATPSYQVSLSGFEAPIAGLVGPWVSTAWSSRVGVRVEVAFASTTKTKAKALLGLVRPALDAATLSWIGVEAPEGPNPLRSFPSGQEAKWLSLVTDALRSNP